METVQRILVPTELGEATSAALSFAMKLALDSGAEIFLLHLEPAHSVTMHVSGLSPADEGAGVQARHRREMHILVDELEHQGIRVHPLLSEDVGGEDIIRYVAPLHIDLVVMGPPKGQGMEVIGGSHALMLIRNTSVPVLLVPDDVPVNFSPVSILFASTFRNDQREALRRVVSLARIFDARIDVAFLNLFSHLIMESVARERVEEIVRLYPQVRFTVNILNTNDEQWGLRTLAGRLHSDIMAVSMEHRSLLGRLLDPSFAERMIRHLELPLLVVHAGP